MNTSGLLQTLQENRSIHDSSNLQKIEFNCLYIHFIINNLYNFNSLSLKIFELEELMMIPVAEKIN